MKELIALVILELGAIAGMGADKKLAWPQFRGPGGSGVAKDQAPPVELGPDKNVKWKVTVPSGLSSPIVVGDYLVLTAFEAGKLYTIAYRRADGAEAWRSEARAKQIEPYYQGEGSPAASTCATDGKRIVSYFGSCGLICYDLEGKEQWRHEMPPAAIFGNFGSGVSPILADGTLILVRDETKNARILALEAATGSLRWEKKRQSPIAYSTPAVWDGPAGKQVVVAGQGRMIGYDLQTGDEKWFLSGMPTGPCASPVVADGMLFYAGWSPGGPDDKENQMPSFDTLLTQGDTNKDGALSREEAQKTPLKDSFDMVDTNKDGKITRDEWDALLKLMAAGQNRVFALSPGGVGDIANTNMVWTKTKGLPYIPSVLVYRGQCIMVKDGGLVSAYDEKTGNEIYVQERVAAAGRYYASPVAANGNIYFTSLDDGVVTVIKAGTSKPEVVHKNPRLGERVAATPAIADNTLYVRTEKHLYAFGKGGPQSKDAAHGTKADTPGAVFKNYQDLKWEKILPDLGASSPEICMLHVDPKTHAAKLLIRTPKGIHIRKHWHGANETHTMIVGTAEFACDGKRIKQGPGSFNYLPAKMVHEAWTSAGSVAFITVDGPRDVNWVDGAPTAADLLE